MPDLLKSKKDRIHKNGLVPLGVVLAYMESAAWRMEQGMTARGNMRAPRADVEIERQN